MPSARPTTSSAPGSATVPRRSASRLRIARRPGAAGTGGPGRPRPVWHSCARSASGHRGWLPRTHGAWPRLVALAMSDAAEDAAGLAEGMIRLKWPNDLVIVQGGRDGALVGDVTAEEARARRSAPIELRKLAGILGETDGLGTDDPRVVVGIGLNAGWPAADFPSELVGSMTSLAEVSARPADRSGGAARRLPRPARDADRSAPRRPVRCRRLDGPPGDDRASRDPVRAGRLNDDRSGARGGRGVRSPRGRRPRRRRRHT